METPKAISHSFNILHVFIVFVLFTSCFDQAHCKALELSLKIPSNVQPGYIVTILPHQHDERLSIVRHNHEPMAKLYSILDQGRLVTREPLENFKGENHILEINHKLRDGSSWVEKIHINIVETEQAVQFLNQPYVGKIKENQPKYTSVECLEDLYSDLKKLPYGCTIDLIYRSSIFFEVKGFPSDPKLYSLIDFDREQQAAIHLMIQATCSGKVQQATITVLILDENDNTPQLSSPFYNIEVPIEDIYQNPKGIFQLEATDSDSIDIIKFSLGENQHFYINRFSGFIGAHNPSELKLKSYELVAYAKDLEEHTSEPSFIRIQIIGNEHVPTTTLLRKRRAAERPLKTFVIRRTEEGELFSVALDYDNTDGETFNFDDPEPIGLLIDSQTGMVSRESAVTWNDTTDYIFFDVNVTRDANPGFQDNQPVEVHIVNRGWEDPIFTNQPRDMWVSIPEWIRPGVTVYQVEAIDAVDYAAPVTYKLESGGEGCFSVDGITGEVTVSCRRQFVIGYSFELGISAQIDGSAKKEATPTQVLRINVGEKFPQFYENYIGVELPETLAVGGTVVTLQGLSFQGLPLTYSINATDEASVGVFNLNSQTGVVTLNSERTHITDPQEYRMRIHMTEAITNLVTPTDLIILLVGENINDPYFFGTYYTRTGVNEDVPVGEVLLEVTAVDIDQGLNGLLRFTTDDPHFVADSINGEKVAAITVASPLDYDAQPRHFYEFTLTATDLGTPPRSGQTMVQVWMTNVLDEAPVLDPPVQVVRVNQEATADTIIHMVQAYDPDNETITFRFTDPQPNQPYDIDGNSGRITLNRQIVSGDTTNLSITVDDGTESSVGFVIIEIIGVNHPPEIPDCVTYSSTARVLENQPAGTSVINMTIRDEDPGVNGELGFSVVRNIAIDPDWFRIGDTYHLGGGEWNVELITSREFDRENPGDPGDVYLIDGKQSYKVTVLAQDNGSPQLGTTCFFFVEIEDENDNYPRFDENPSYKVITMNNVPQNDRIVQIFAVDDDTGLSTGFSYVLESDDANCAGCFNLDGATGWITRAGTGTLTPGEMVVLKVTTDDGGAPGETVNVNIQITDNQANLPPQWNENIDDIATTLYENVSTGLLDGLIYTTNKQGVLSVRNGRTPMENSLPAPFGQLVFNNDMSMNVRLLRKLDYESVTEYSVRLRSSLRDADQTGPFNDARLRIHIEDVNDNPPEFVGQDEVGSYPAAVSDQTNPGDFVVKVTAVDRDGTAPHNTVSYNFDPDCGADCTAFQINAATGNIEAAQNFNPLNQTEYFVRVVASDGSLADGQNQPHQVDITVRIAVTGESLNPPYFDQTSYQFSISSGAALNTTAAVVEATDPTGGLNVMQYQILAGNEARAFACDIDTGRIYTVAEILYEHIQEFNLQFAVFDGYRTVTTNVQFTVQARNVYPPVFSLDEYTSTVSVLENNTVSQKIFLQQVVASDPEFVGSISYAIEGYYSSRFSINGSGAVFLEQTLDRDYPDGHAQWLITLVANDQDGNPLPQNGYASLVFGPGDINDNFPFFNVCCVIGYVNEDAAINTLVLQLEAVDFDENDPVIFGAVSFPNNGVDDLFRVTSAGEILTNVADYFDRETEDQYTGRVFAEDSAGHRTEQAVIIIINDVNDNPPIFGPDSYIFDMPEGLPVGANVGAVFATDEDIGENSRLTFAIVGTGDAATFFYMDSLYLPQAGVIRVQQMLDFENSADPKTFNFQVEVSDGQSIDQANVIINVIDVNDHAPVITPRNISRNIQENNLATNIAEFVATDGDGDIIDFVIDYENTDQEKKFWVGPSDGIVSLIEPLDRETKESYELYILAKDRANPQLTGTATLIITVDDTNDNAPFITGVNPNPPWVGASDTVGSFVTEITVMDPDLSGGPISVQYCQDAPCQDFTFSFNAGQGSGTLSANRDGYSREELGRSFYDLDFTWSDSGGNSATESVRVYIESVNTKSQEPGQSNITVYNYRAMLPDTQIGQVFCQDVDDWDLQDKTFTPFEEYVYFTIASETGIIMMRRGAPQGEHILEVEVSDSTWNIVTTCTTSVRIIYLYDDAIEASGSIYISGITADDFIERPTTSEGVLGDSGYDILAKQLASFIGITHDDVHIFTVVDSGEDAINLFYSVKIGNTYYRPASLNGLIWTNKEQLETDLGVIIESAPNSLCTDDLCFGSGCATVVDPLIGEASPVFTNQTSLVGISVMVTSECVCSSTNYTTNVPMCEYWTCGNNGTCEEYYNGYSCSCEEGFDGPHCEQTRLSFSGGGWAWFDPLPPCDELSITFDILTDVANGLLLYNGPMYESVDAAVVDYLYVQLEAGYPVMRADLGDGEVVIMVNGQNQGGQPVMGQLSDGRWHTVEIYKLGQDFTLTVDHCRMIQSNETLDYTTEDRTPCEGHVSSTGVHHLLNVFTPLELGGRAKPSIDRPANVQGNQFNGCMKDVWVNNQLYDLHVGDVGQSTNTEDGCSREGCGSCPPNSTCHQVYGTDNYICLCLPGLMGPNCDIETPLLDFTRNDSYIEWGLKPSFNGSQDVRNSELQLQFRTRQENGIVFIANSFSTLERAILEVVDSSLQFRYDLGEGDLVLRLAWVNVSDGEWHTAYVKRWGKQVTLQLDGGEGRLRVEVKAEEGFSLLYVGEGVYGAATVSRHPYSQDASVSLPLVNSCLRDIRFNQEWFPMDASMNGDSGAADVKEVMYADDICDSNACGAGVTCPFGFCEDVWREHMCVCPPGEMFDGTGLCVPITDCSYDWCVMGDCVLVDNPDPPPALIWRCNCYPGWTGVYCNETVVDTAATSATVSTGWIIAVAMAMVLLLILILIVVCCTKRRKAGLLDEPDDLREKFCEYNEEGAGEDDMQAFDLAPLRKPVEVPREMRPMEIVQPPLLEELPRTAPEPMHGSRQPVTIPTDFPDVGKFIVGRLGDADADQTAPPYDSVREYEYEGSGSTAGSLSSIQTSSSGDGDFDFLTKFGIPFRRIADLYIGVDEEDEDDDAGPRRLLVVDHSAPASRGQDRRRMLSTSDSNLAQSSPLELADHHTRSLSGSEGNIMRGILRNSDHSRSLTDLGGEQRKGILRRSAEIGDLSSGGVTFQQGVGERYDQAGRSDEHQNAAYAALSGSRSEGHQNAAYAALSGETTSYRAGGSSSGTHSLSPVLPGAVQVLPSDGLQQNSGIQRVITTTTTTTRRIHHRAGEDPGNHQEPSQDNDSLSDDQRPMLAHGSMPQYEFGDAAGGISNPAYEEFHPSGGDTAQSLYLGGYERNQGLQGENSRIVKTEHVTWSDRHVKKIDDYGDV